MVVSSKFRDGSVEKLMPSARRGSSRFRSPMKNRSKYGASPPIPPTNRWKPERVPARHRPVERRLHDRLDVVVAGTEQAARDLQRQGDAHARTRQDGIRARVEIEGGDAASDPAAARDDHVIDGQRGRARGQLGVHRLLAKVEAQVDVRTEVLADADACRRRASRASRRSRAGRSRRRRRSGGRTRCRRCRGRVTERLRP